MLVLFKLSPIILTLPLCYQILQQKGPAAAKQILKAEMHTKLFHQAQLSLTAG